MKDSNFKKIKEMNRFEPKSRIDFLGIVLNVSRKIVCDTAVAKNVSRLNIHLGDQELSSI